MFQVFNSEKLKYLFNLSSSVGFSKQSPGEFVSTKSAPLRERFHNNWNDIFKLTENNILNSEKISALNKVVASKQIEEKALLNNLAENLYEIPDFLKQMNVLKIKAYRMRESLDKFALTINKLHQDLLDSEFTLGDAKITEDFFLTEARNKHKNKTDLFQEQTIKENSFRTLARATYSVGEPESVIPKDVSFPSIEFKDPDVDDFYDSISATETPRLTSSNTSNKAEEISKNALVEAEEDYSD